MIVADPTEVAINATTPGGISVTYTKGTFAENTAEPAANITLPSVSTGATAFTAAEVSAIGASDDIKVTEAGGSTTLDAWIKANFTLPDYDAINWVFIKAEVAGSAANDPLLLFLLDWNKKANTWNKVARNAASTADVIITYNITPVNISRYISQNFTKHFLAVLIAATGSGSATDPSVDYLEIRVNFNDTTAPKFSNNFTSVPNGTAYDPNRNYGFQINWTDRKNSTSYSGNISNVTFEINLTNGFTNYTVLTTPAIQQSDQIYFINFTGLGGGRYQYKWYANDSAMNPNSTTNITYYVNKNNVTVRLAFNGTEGSRSYSNDAGVFAGITGFNDTLSGNASTQIRLYANFSGGNTFAELPATGTTNRTNITTTANLAAGGYVIIANFTGNANWTDNSTGQDYTLTVTAGNTAPVIRLIAPSDVTYSSGQTINITAVAEDADGGGQLQNALLRFNDTTNLGSLRNYTNATGDGFTVTTTRINNTAYQYEWLTTILPANGYQINNVHVNDSSANANTGSATFSINKANLGLTLTLDGTAGDVTKTYPNNVVTVACSETNPGDGDASYVCSRDNTTSLGTGSSVSVIQDLDASAITYKLQYNITQTTLQNYSAPVSLTRQLTVNKGTLNDTGLTEAQTVTYEISSTVTSSISASTFKGDDDVTYQLWRGNDLADNTLT